MNAPLVLIHSSGTNATLWDRVAGHLTGVPLLAITLPGRAGVPWPEQEHERDVAAYARFVLSVLDGAGVSAATIAGHSLGGAVAMLLALDYPQRVAGLGLSGTGARLRVVPQMLEALGDGVRDALDVFVNMHAGVGPSDRDRVALHRMVEATGLEQTHIDLCACDQFDVMERLGEIRCPTQVLGGELDLAAPPKYSRYLAEKIAGARLTMFPRAGHGLPLECAEEVAGDLAVLWAATSPR